MAQEPPPSVDITLLVCTFNRSTDLREMLETAVNQQTDGSFTYEVLIVDNNSTDDTRQVVERFITAGAGGAAGRANVRYLFEGRQGKGYALNTGLAAARGSFYTIADDDFVLPPGWIQSIMDGFRRHPDASFVSGKVLPLWQGDVPAWAGPQHWSALALADYGDELFYTDRNRQVCLLACSFRRDHVAEVGGYRSALGVFDNLIGSVEDLDILQRLWKAGRKGVYLPNVAFQHKVPAGRLTKSYHRRWHTGHGRFYARLRDVEFERSRARLFDVPIHMYRLAAASAIQWLKWTLLRRESEALACEGRVRFFLGFLRERRQTPRTSA